MKNSDKQNPEYQAQHINSSLDKLEATRQEETQRARALQMSKDKALLRERGRLSRKYGNEHLRVQKIDRELASNPELFRAIKEQERRTKAKPPTRDESSWGVFGTVRNEKNELLPGLTLAFYDEKGKWVQALGYTCTDSLGAYALKVDDPKGELVEKYGSEPLFLRVTNDERDVLYSDEKAVWAKAGQLYQRELVLEGRSCGTPPEEEETPDVPFDYLVGGIVRDEAGAPQAQLIVTAFDQDFTDENKLGEAATTNDKGEYLIAYQSTDFIIDGKETGGADIILRVADANGEMLHETEPYRNAPRVATVDINLGDKPKRRSRKKKG